MILSAADLRDHLNMTDDEASNLDTRMFDRLISAAESHTERQLGFKLDSEIEFPDGAPEDVRQAILMLAAHWFDQREAATANAAMMPVPFGYNDIIANHRTYTYG